MGLWSVHKSSTLLFLPPHNSPCFSAGSLHSLQSFQNRYCVGPLDGLQALRISLLQHWSFTGCSSFRTWPPALAWSPQQAAEWKTAPSQVPSMGCRGNFLLWCLKHLSPFFSHLSVAGLFLTLLFSALTPVCRILLSQQCCPHG